MEEGRVTSAHSRAFTSFRKPRVSSGPAKLHTPTCARLWRASRPSSHTGHLFLKIRVCRYRSSLAIATDSAGASDLRLHLPSQRPKRAMRSEEHTSELQSHHDLVCRLL